MVREIERLNGLLDLPPLAEKWLCCEGLPYFLVMILPLREGEVFSSRSIVSNWPTELIKGLDATPAAYNWTCLRLLKEQVTPFSHGLMDWSPGTARCDVANQSHLLRQNGMLVGHFFPVHDARGNTGAIVLTGMQAELSIRSRAALQMVSILIFNKVALLGGTPRRQSGPITLREAECLSWTAAGKTSAEIARILKISEHTVNHLLFQATRKLDAANRTQAVAKSLRCGWISASS